MADDRPVRRALIRGFGRLHAWVYEASDGRLGAKLKGLPMLLLVTTGRKSGEPRTAPLLYLPDGERCVVVASYYGAPNDPVWYKNLQANPRCRVRAGRRRFEATARTAQGEERSDLWKRLVDLYADYADYQRRTDRQIPVVVLE